MAYSISQRSSAVRSGAISSAKLLGIFFPPISNIVHLHRNLIKSTIMWKLAESEARRNSGSHSYLNRWHEEFLSSYCPGSSSLSLQTGLIDLGESSLRSQKYVSIRTCI